MDYKFQLKYALNALLCLVCLELGELINITKIYNDFGRPKNLSPQKLLNSRSYMVLVGDQILKSNNEKEKVIKYQGKDIYVDGVIALTYLKDLDNYFSLNQSSNNSTDEGYKGLPPENQMTGSDKDSMMDYMDLPF